MPHKPVSHLLLATSLTLVAAGAFGVLHAPQDGPSIFLADTTDDYDGVGWCCPDFGEACVNSDTAYTCAYEDGGILYSETKEGCQTQCTPGGLSSSSAAGGSAASASAGSAASGSKASASKASASAFSVTSVFLSSSSSSSVSTSSSSSSSSMVFASVSSSSVSGEPFYVWCAPDHRLHVGQDSWNGFAAEHDAFVEAGGTVMTIAAEDIDEYWSVSFEDDVAECATVTLSSSSSKSSSSSSVSTSASTSSSSSTASFASSKKSKSSVAPAATAMACDRRLGTDAACYSYVPYYHQSLMPDLTLFLGDLATPNICGAVCPALRTIAMCALESECGPADANLCVQENGFAVGFLKWADVQALDRGYESIEEEAYDTCEAWRCEFFGAC